MKYNKIYSIFIAATVGITCLTSNIAYASSDSINMKTSMVAGASTISEQKKYSLNLNDYASDWTHMTKAEHVELRGSDIHHLDNPTYADVDCYSLENVVYTATPKDSKVEVMNIYVPTAYLEKNADGKYSINTKGTCNGYTAETAPIIYENTINGYEQGAPAPLGCSRGDGQGYYYDFVNAGYVVVGVGTLGNSSTITNSDGTKSYIGKAPMPIVDLKAGVRFLKSNDSILPGDSNRIFASGASAGGAMAALLGASGNSSDFDSYLNGIGAANTTDDICGVLDFCPLTNLDNADASYEWLHYSQQTFKPVVPGAFDPNAKPAVLDSFQKTIADKLVSNFISYIDGLGIKSTLDAYDSTGKSGSFYDNLVKVYSECLTDYINKYQTDGASYVKSLAGNSNNEYATWDAYMKTAKITNFETFKLNIMPRGKGVPSFDGLEYGKAENGIFGNENGDQMHFSTTMLNILTELSKSSDSEISTKANSYISKYESEITSTQLNRVYIMNPLNYMGTDENCTTAKNWRFRVGAADGDVGVVTAYTMAQVLSEKEKDANVDFNVVWGKGHTRADYSITDVINYLNNICKK